MQDQSVRIKDLPEKVSPVERLLSLGSESLIDKELLAILIRCGSKK